MSPRRLPEDDDVAEWTAEWRLPDDGNALGEPPGRHEWPEIAEARTGQWAPGPQQEEAPHGAPGPAPATAEWPDVAGVEHTAAYDVRHEEYGEPPASEPFPADDPEAASPHDSHDSYERRPPPPDRLVYSPHRSAGAGGDTSGDTTVSGQTERTGFLGSGWQGDDDDSSPGPYKGVWGGEKPAAEPRKRGRVAVLSVAAVVALLGGSVAGVQIMTRSAEAPTATKLVTAPSTSATPSTFSEPAETPEEEAEPTAEETGEPAKKPKTSAPPQSTQTAAPRRTQRPRATEEPRPKKTRTPDNLDNQETPPRDTKPTGSPRQTEEPRVRDDENRPAPPSAQPTTGPTGPPDGGGLDSRNDNIVEIDVNLFGRLAGYSAELSIANASATDLTGVTLDLAVSGRVTKVEGADWDYSDGTLTLRLPRAIPAGGRVSVEYRALGRSKAPSSCEVTGITCLLR
ncbi:hypothetical protein [Spongiactinospora rosea]|uniref:hypothetical protein n=1 Tax=Spongiactinospora rosea TaxID=2248750 RepID=UPI0011C06759|nr:hypothetical protein [Spongiactinospora rosea]